jgi:hypothetical protein
MAAERAAESTYAWVSFLLIYILPISTDNPITTTNAIAEAATVTSTKPRSLAFVRGDASLRLGLISMASSIQLVTGILAIRHRLGNEARVQYTFK